VRKKGLIVDPAKIIVIVNLPQPKFIALVKSHTGTYKVLKKCCQGVCTNYCTDGKKFEEGHMILVE
jgi:hypothetical protein